MIVVPETPITDVSFTINKGETIAILGKTGSGKYRLLVQLRNNYWF